MGNNNSTREVSPIYTEPAGNTNQNKRGLGEPFYNYHNYDNNNNHNNSINLGIFILAFIVLSFHLFLRSQIYNKNYIKS